MSSVGAELRIEGFVQGVGYRYFCLVHARNLDLTGWVKNNPDGSVLALVEGDRSRVESLIVELKIGPSSAVVKDISIKWLDLTGQYSDFKVKS
ncbi:MAG: acylphosphatase [candidate division Zixibacteria bacterium]|nr:acylphosphatase [candidate division Zixibacteria bacterium]